MPDRSSGAYDPKIREELDKQNWKEVIPRVLKYARWAARGFQWLGMEAEPEQLLQEAIARAYGGGKNGNVRNWNKQKCPDIATFLNGIIRSMLSHAAASAKKYKTESILMDDGSPKEITISPVGHAVAASLVSMSPEEMLLSMERLRAIEAELDVIEQEDIELGLVVLCIREGQTKALEIADITGIDINIVYKLKERLRNRLKRFNNIREAQRKSHDK